MASRLLAQENIDPVTQKLLSGDTTDLKVSLNEIIPKYFKKPQEDRKVSSEETGGRDLLPLIGQDAQSGPKESCGKS